MNDASTLSQSPAADLRLSRDSAEFERIFYHPSLRAEVLQKGQVPADLGPLLSDRGNIGFLFNGCCFLAYQLEPHVYELRSASLPETPFGYTAGAATAVVRWLFFASPALEILSRVVEDNRSAGELVALLGFSMEFRRENLWQSERGSRAVHFYALRYPEWVKRQDWLCASGEWLLGRVEGRSRRDREPAWYLYAGAAVEMLLSGQAEKAVALYNRWARFAGYEPIAILSTEPLTIDLGPRRLIVSNGELEVITCQ